MSRSVANVHMRNQTHGKHQVSVENPILTGIIVSLFLPTIIFSVFGVIILLEKIVVSEA